MGLGKRLEAAGVARKWTFYVLVIGKDVKKLAEAKSRKSDEKDVRKSTQALARDLAQLRTNAAVVAIHLGSWNFLECHDALARSTVQHLQALNGGSSQAQGDTWQPLQLAMRDWCERVKPLDLQVNPKGGDATTALALLSSLPNGQQPNIDNPSSDTRPRFAEVQTGHFMGRQVEKKLLSKKFVRVAPMLSVCVFLFEQGALLGSAYRDRFGRFVVPFCAAINNTVESLMETEARRLAAYIPEVKSIHQLCFLDAMRKENPGASADIWADWLATKVDERVTPEEAFGRGNIYAAMGAGFGAHYPAEFEALYSASYPSYPIEQRRAEANADFEELCSAYYPELVRDLLSNYPSTAETSGTQADRSNTATPPQGERYCSNCYRFLASGVTSCGYCGK